MKYKFYISQLNYMYTFALQFIVLFNFCLKSTFNFDSCNSQFIVIKFKKKCTHLIHSIISIYTRISVIYLQSDENLRKSKTNVWSKKIQKQRKRNSGSEKRECDKDRKGDTMRESQSINVCGDRSSVRPRSSQRQRNTTFTTLARCSVAPDFSPHQHFFQFCTFIPTSSLSFSILLRLVLWLLRCLNSSVIQVNWLLSRLVTFKPRAIDIYEMPCSTAYAIA